MIVYRIVHKAVKQLLSGSGNDTRWCSGGRKVIYTSSSVTLACLENVLRRGGFGFAADFRTILYEIPDKIIIGEIKPNKLHKDWRLRNSYPHCQSIGNKWYDDKNAFILKLPSAIITDEYNYVIKTTSPHIDHIKVVADKPFIPDERLELLLKNVDARKLKSA